jgi:hypothetical protein
VRPKGKTVAELGGGGIQWHTWLCCMYYVYFMKNTIFRFSVRCCSLDLLCQSIKPYPALAEMHRHTHTHTQRERRADYYLRVLSIFNQFLFVFDEFAFALKRFRLIHVFLADVCNIFLIASANVYPRIDIL